MEPRLVKFFEWWSKVLILAARCHFEKQYQVQDSSGPPVMTQAEYDALVALRLIDPADVVEVPRASVLYFDPKVYRNYAQRGGRKKGTTAAGRDASGPYVGMKVRVRLAGATQIATTEDGRRLLVEERWPHTRVFEPDKRESSHVHASQSGEMRPLMLMTKDGLEPVLTLSRKERKRVLIPCAEEFTPLLIPAQKGAKLPAWEPGNDRMVPILSGSGRSRAPLQVNWNGTATFVLVPAERGFNAVLAPVAPGVTPVLMPVKDEQESRVETGDVIMVPVLAKFAPGMTPSVDTGEGATIPLSVPDRKGAKDLRIDCCEIEDFLRERRLPFYVTEDGKELGSWVEFYSDLDVLGPPGVFIACQQIRGLSTRLQRGDSPSGAASNNEATGETKEIASANTNGPSSRPLELPASVDAKPEPARGESPGGKIRHWTNRWCPNCGSPCVEFLSQSEFSKRTNRARQEGQPKLSRNTVNARIDRGTYCCDRIGHLPWCPACREKTPEGRGELNVPIEFPIESAYKPTTEDHEKILGWATEAEAMIRRKNDCVTCEGDELVNVGTIAIAEESIRRVNLVCASEAVRIALSAMKKHCDDDRWSRERQATDPKSIDERPLRRPS